MNLGGFIKGIAGDYWRVAAAVVAAAVLSASLGYCQGRKDGWASADVELAVAARKVTEAALKAERAANAADQLRRDAARARETELREIVNAQGSDAVVGGAVGGVIGKLRSNAGGADKTTKR